METYLDKILEPEVLITLAVVFFLGRIISGGKSSNSLSPRR